VPETHRITIHEAALASGASGAVQKGAAISFEAAVERRRAGLDVVVCGNDRKANFRRAGEIESVIGPWEREPPHVGRAGENALPHLHQASRSPAGHCFYETENRKARKQR
jgi:hypothetical protein